MKGSELFWRFVKSYHDSGSTRERRESFDLAALCQLEGAEREAAEVLLLERLENNVEDPRVPDALHAMKPSENALEAMRSALKRYPDNHTRIALASVLWKLEKSPDSVSVLIEIAKTPTWTERRIAAINALRDIETIEADDALFEAIEKYDDEAVHMIAQIALFEKYKLDGLRHTDERISALYKNLHSRDEKQRVEALEELRSLITVLRSKG